MRGFEAVMGSEFESWGAVSMRGGPRLVDGLIRVGVASNLVAGWGDAS